LHALSRCGLINTFSLSGRNRYLAPGTMVMTRPGEDDRHWRFSPRVALTAIILFAILIGFILFASRELWARYHYRAAQQAHAAKDPAAEYAHLLQCLRVWTTSGETYLLAAQAARRTGDFDEAEKLLKRSDQLAAPPSSVLLERLLLGFQRHPADYDLHALLATARNAPPNQEAVGELLEALSRACLKSFRLSEARSCLDLWIEREPANLQALLWRGWVLEQVSGNSQLPLADYRQAVWHHPNEASALFRLAEILLRAKLPEEALPHLVTLDEKQPDNPLLLVNLAACRQELGEPAAARTLLDRMLTPQRLRLVEQLAERARALQPVPEELASASWYRQAFAVAPFGNDGQAHYVVDLYIRGLLARAALALADGHPAEAETDLRTAVKLDPFDYSATYQLFLCLEQQGRKEETRDWKARLEQITADQKQMSDLVQQVRQAPRNPAPRCAAGKILLRNGQPGEAIRWLESALHEDSTYEPAHALLTEWYDKAGDRDRAAQHRAWVRQPSRSPGSSSGGPP
jgi:tetratricopeptide (TPR) repeat protein